MKIINFATSNHVGLENLKLSISKAGGWEQIVIGMNVRWQGWITRMNAYKDFCQSLEDQNEIIVLSDAYDVLCIRNGNDFQEVYNQYANKKIIIGAEKGCAMVNCFPPEQYWFENNIDKNEARRFVNNGLIAGPANKLAAMWTWAIENEFKDDQFAVGNYTDQFPQEIFLDKDILFFFNDENATSEYELNEKDNSITIENKIVKFPFFIHFHGININSSIPIANTQKKLFQVGLNYKKIGSTINGPEHITGFPPDNRSSQMGVWIERSAFYLVFFISFAILIILIIYKK